MSQSRFLVGACGLSLLAALSLVGCVDSSAPDEDELLGSGGASSASGGATGSGGQGATQPFWVNLYYPGWTQERLPPSEIDYEAVTQIIHFAWLPVVDASDVLTL